MSASSHAAWCGGQVFGFLNGPHGIFSNVYTEIDKGLVADFRNMGGFDMIGSGCVSPEPRDLTCHASPDRLHGAFLRALFGSRHKIHTAEQFAASLKTCTECVRVPVRRPPSGP